MTDIDSALIDSHWEDRFLMSEKQMARWNKKIKVNQTTDCHEWQTKDKGYGSFSVLGRSRKAHRVSWLMYRGQIPKGLEICHHCDNKRCVNPDHLFLGTRKENMLDCTSKQRANMGERHSDAKLTEQQVIEIRAFPKKWGSGVHLSKKYRVSHQVISDIRSGKTWKHLLAAHCRLRQRK